MGTHMHMGEARVLAYTRMGYPYTYGQPIHVRVAHMHMGCQYTYGLPICVWDSPYAYGQHYLQLEVTCTHSKKDYKSTGVYGETIFRIHLNVWSKYYHFNNSVIQVYNKYVHRISYNFPWQISLSVITYLPWLQPLSQLVS